LKILNYISRFEQVDLVSKIVLERLTRLRICNFNDHFRN